MTSRLCVRGINEFLCLDMGPAVIWNVPQRPRCWRLGPQPVALLGGAGTFNIWGPAGGLRSLDTCPRRGLWEPGLFLSLFHIPAMRKPSCTPAVTCRRLTTAHAGPTERGLKPLKPPKPWDKINTSPFLSGLSQLLHYSYRKLTITGPFPRYCTYANIPKCGKFQYPWHYCPQHLR
jgi:hypothetical protein